MLTNPFIDFEMPKFQGKSDGIETENDLGNLRIWYRNPVLLENLVVQTDTQPQQNITLEKGLCLEVIDVSLSVEEIMENEERTLRLEVKLGVMTREGDIYSYYPPLKFSTKSSV